MLFGKKYPRCTTLPALYGTVVVILTFIFGQRSFPCCYPIGNSTEHTTPSLPQDSSSFRYEGEISSQLKNKTAYITDAYTTSVRKRLNGFKTLRLPVNSSLARPFLRIKSYYRIAPRYALSFCLIEKAMCTLLQSVFCYLYDSDGFLANNRTIPTEEWNERFCLNKNEVASTQEKHLRVPFNKITIFMVRSPKERFLSGFIDKCINENSTCYNCTGDILCAVEGFHAEIMKMNAEHWDITVPKTSYISQSYETQHMAPSNWMCDLYEESNNFIFIKYGETVEELKKTYENLFHIFEAHGVEKGKLIHIFKSISRLTKHATKQSGIRERYLEQLKSSAKHVRLLNEVYFYEYKIFGFEPLQ